MEHLLTTENLIEEVKHPLKSHFLRDDSSADRIRGSLKPGDIFLTLGAGDGWKLGMEVLGKL